MATQFKIKRGLKANLPSSAQEGEPLITLDTGELFIGKGEGQQLLPISNNGIFYGDDGRKFKFVSCVLRNTGSGWFAIDDSGHKPLNVLSVSNDATQITVNYNFTANKVVSFLCVPDETMAQEGYICGSSVGTSLSNIQISRVRDIGGYIYYDGSAWQYNSLSEGIQSFSFNAGILTVTHAEVSGVLANATSRDGTYVVALGSVGTTTTQIKFIDYAGTTITTPNTNMKCFFSRPAKSGYINPNNYTNSSGNIWCFGIFEV